MEKLYAGAHEVSAWSWQGGARDKTSGVPVTTFKHSTRLYRIAMKYNSGLDRDKDDIACEKH
jgi:hypothetical protein